MAAQLLDLPDLRWLAIVAFWGCMVDNGGAWQDRFVALTGFTVVATIGVVIGLAVAPNPFLSIIFTVIWCFFGGMTRIYGATASTAGTMLMSDFLVTLGIPAVGPNDFLIRPVMTVAGGLWAMLLVLVIWRLYPLTPGRRHVAQCWQSIGAYTEAIARLHEPQENGGSPEAWALLVRNHRGQSRAAIEAARQVVAGLRRGRAGESSRVLGLISLLSEADQTFERIIALSTLLELEVVTDTVSQRTLMVALHRLAQQGRAVSASILSHKSKVNRHPVLSVARLRRLQSEADADDIVLQRAVTLIDEISALMAEAGEEACGVRAPKTLADAIAQPGQKMKIATIWLQFRTDLDLNSVYLRHATRLALATGIAEILVRSFDLPRGYWFTLTVAMILQPFIAVTWRRSLERVIGSVIGGIIAAIIGLIFHDPPFLALIIFPLSIVTIAVRSVNYALFVFWLTPTFVLIAELFQSGTAGGIDLAALRALNSTYGGILALIASFLLWPSWEGPHLAALVASAVRGSKYFFHAVLSENTHSDSIMAARRQAGLSSNNAEASLQRLMGEPHRQLPAGAGPAMVMLSSIRRLGGIATVLGISRNEPRTPVVRNIVSEFKPWIDQSLEAIATALDQHLTIVSLTSPPDIGLVQEKLTHSDRLVLRELDLTKAQINIMASGAEWLGQTES